MSAMLIKGAQRGAANVTTTWGDSLRMGSRQPRRDFHLTLQSVATIFCFSYLVLSSNKGIRFILKNNEKQICEKTKI